jgi:hypothetical protein
VDVPSGWCNADNFQHTTGGSRHASDSVPYPALVGQTVAVDERTGARSV